MTRATTFRATAVIGGVLLAMLMIMTVSRAAFSDVTSNDGNSVAAGTVVLYNDATDGGTSFNPGDETGDAMFGTAEEAAASTWTVRADNLNPGTPVEHCIEVSYAGSLDSTARFESVVAGTPSLTGFDEEINVTVERFATACGVAGDGSTVISGTLGTPGSSSETPWSATDGDSQFYLVTLELDSGVDNAFQGESLDGINFQWIANQLP